MSTFSSSRDSGDRHSNGMTRMTFEEADDTQAIQQSKLNGYHDESMDTIEHVHPYGFTAVPQKPTGSGDDRQTPESFSGFMGGNRTHGIALVTADRRYRLYKLANGEVALHDDQGHQVHFKRDGIYVSAPNSKKIVGQIMDDDKLPQDGKLGQIQQAGRPSANNYVLDKNSFTINHAVAINLNAPAITVNAGAHLNLVGGAGVHTVGKTYLGVDAKDETVKPIVPDVDLDPAKQTFVKIA
jgi:phage gp45-like